MNLVIFFYLTILQKDIENDDTMNNIDWVTVITCICASAVTIQMIIKN